MKYSLTDMYSTYMHNKENVDAYLKGEKIEHYKPDEKIDPSQLTGSAIAIFSIMMLFSLAIYIWALVAFIKYHQYMPSTAIQIIAGLGLVPMVPLGPIVTLILVYTTKTNSPMILGEPRILQQPLQQPIGLAPRQQAYANQRF